MESLTEPMLHIFFLSLNYRMTLKLILHKKMLVKFWLVKHIIGVIGASAEVVTASIYGQTRRHWNFQMEVMDGSVLFWMENWPQCIAVAVLKLELIALVS